MNPTIKLPQNNREVETFLRDNGFTFIRRTKTGELWGDGTNTVLAGYTVTDNFRNLRNLVADVKRAILMRPTDRRPGKDTEALTRVISRPDYVSANKREALKYKMSEVMRVTAPAIAPSGQEKKEEEKKMPTPTTQAQAARNGQDHALEQQRFARAQLERERRQEDKAEPEPESRPEAPKAQHPVPAAPPLGSRRRRPLVRRFTDAARKPVWERILQLHAVRLSSHGIARALTREGFRMSDGSEIPSAYVRSSLMNIRASPEYRDRLTQAQAEVPRPVPAPRPKAEPAPPAKPLPVPVPEKQAVAPPKKPAWKLPDVILSILTDPDLRPEHKLRMLCPLERSGRLPAMAIAILREADLTDSEKVEMLMGFVDL